MGLERVEHGHVAALGCEGGVDDAARGRGGVHVNAVRAEAEAAPVHDTPPR